MCSSEMIWTSTHPPTSTAASTVVLVRSLRRTAAATTTRSGSCSRRQWHREQHSFPKQCGFSLAFLVDAASANSSLCHCRLLVINFAKASEGLRHLPRALFPSHHRRSRHRSCPRPAGLPTASGRKSGSHAGLEVTRALWRRPSPPHCSRLYRQTAARLPSVVLFTTRCALPVALLLRLLAVVPMAQRHPPDVVFQREHPTVRAKVRQSHGSLPIDGRDDDPAEDFFQPRGSATRGAAHKARSVPFYAENL